MAEDDLPPKIERRTLLRNMAFAGGGIYLVEWGLACKEEPAPTPPPVAPPPPVAAAPKPHLPQKPTDHRVFDNYEWATLVACVDRILPKDEDPGGVEADVPEYIDRTLTDPALHQMRDDFLSGIDAFDRASLRQRSKPFAELPSNEQDDLLASFAARPEGSGEARFYETLITLCLEGFLGDPTYGGNRDKKGWATIGFEPGPPMPMPKKKG